MNCPTPRHPIDSKIFVQQPHYDVLDASAVGTGAVWTWCGGACAVLVPSSLTFAFQLPHERLRCPGALLSHVRLPASLPRERLRCPGLFPLNRIPFASLKNGCYNLSVDCYKHTYPIRSKRTKMLLQPEQHPEGETVDANS